MHPAIEAAGMLWPEHLDPMRTVYPALGRVQCPVSILAGSDVSASDPTESIALFIEDATKEFPRGRFERCASSLGPALPPFSVPFPVLPCCVPCIPDATQHAQRSRSGIPSCFAAAFVLAGSKHVLSEPRPGLSPPGCWSDECQAGSGSCRCHGHC